ncbi:hypothetical protein BJ875DRAFT_477912 [Amylocarpus encephaloides]|uniref:Integral membrane protein n=1 Tax=Amylocarpus encephaloides TaxID=45428 RepID=A0A9P8BYZ6_9HELO|nr:hypothetical protein BJ875DRAFT_477912 [Amylocarpus encephaloides]
MKISTDRRQPLAILLPPHGVPTILRPVLRAYVLGYLSSAAPRVLTLTLTYLTRKQKGLSPLCRSSFFSSLRRIIRGGLELQRFPTFCATLVGGTTLLQFPLQALVAVIASSRSGMVQVRLARWLSTFIAAWFSLRLLQSKKSKAFIEYVPEEASSGIIQKPIHFAGRTMDLTLFAVTRAVDVVVGELWSQRRRQKRPSSRRMNLETLTSTLADPAVFAASCALIMWAWVYAPDRLPRSYNKWIKTAAMVDHRLLLALRRTRYGEIKYGLETGQADLLGSMCKDYNLPESCGDPVKTIPFPCEIVHMGSGPNCEYHALSRLVKSFLWAFSTYLPLNLLLALRNPTRKTLLRALQSSARSSAFLGSFIASFYYGICLARTRLGPSLLGTSIPKRQMIDGGICIGSGCVFCGWSVLLENAGRRKELGLFVVPRALATLLPRRYEVRDQWRENLAFGVSTAVVFTCVREKPERVRGVFGKVLGKILK